MKKTIKKLTIGLALCTCLTNMVACNNDNKDLPLFIKISDTNPTYVECGNKIQLEAEVQNDKDDKGISWSIDDEMLATIDQNGVLTGISQGRVAVTLTSNSNPETKEVIYVDVKYNTLITVNITSSVTSMKVGEETTLKATINGDTTNSGIGWQVNNDALATITSDGKLKILQQGREGKVIVNAFSLINPNAVSDNLEIEIKPNDKGETMLANEVETAGQNNEYKLIYKDDFNTKRLNKNSWEVMIGDGSKYGVSRWGNQEEQFYREDNLKFNDGSLVITAKREDGRNDTKNLNYTSGRIRSAKKVAYKYGRIEARLACPTGYGLWPAFWMLPENSTPYGAWPNSGEIDIMEAKGRLPEVIDGTIHFAKPSGSHTWENGTYLFPQGENITQYHVYAVEWEEREIRWYVDGNLYFTANADENSWTMKDGTGEFPAPFDQEFHILFNMAVGGNYDGFTMPSMSDLPARYKIDYVKWFQK